MTLVIKPISAILTKDLDLFGKMVRLSLYRIPMLYAQSALKRKGVRLTTEEEKNPTGPIHSSLIPKPN